MLRIAASLVLVFCLRIVWAAGDTNDHATWLDMRASELVGTPVASVDGTFLGKVEDLVVDPAGRYMPHVVLSFGGVGAGDKMFVFPAYYLMRGENRDGLVLAAERGQISEAAGFDRSNWPYRPQLARASKQR